MEAKAIIILGVVCFIILVGIMVSMFRNDDEI